MKFDSHKALIAYSGVTTAALAVFLLTAASQSKRTEFDEIDVGRINVREPDGTLRMTISSAARSPGIIVKGQEQPHPSRQKAGLLFFNDEGTETGGLIFGGHEVDGKATSGGSLTFDRYEQDQVVQVVAVEDGEKRYSGLFVNDQPETRIDFAALERARVMEPGEARQAAFAAANVGGGKTRAFIGRWTDSSSQVQLRDPQGRKRLILSVDEEGKAKIAFLDEAGHVVRTITPET